MSTNGCTTAVGILTEIRLWPNGAGYWKGDIHEAMVFDGKTEGSASRVSWSTTAIPPWPATSIRSSASAPSGPTVNFKGRRSTVAVACIKVMAQWAKPPCSRADSGMAERAGPLRGEALGPPGASMRVCGCCTGLQPLPDVYCWPEPMRSATSSVPAPVAALLEQHSGIEVDLSFGLTRHLWPTARTASGKWCCGPRNARVTPAGIGCTARWEYDAIVHAFPDPAVLRAAQSAGIPIRIGTGRRLHALPRLTHRNGTADDDLGDMRPAQLAPADAAGVDVRTEAVRDLLDAPHSQ